MQLPGREIRSHGGRDARARRVEAGRREMRIGSTAALRSRHRTLPLKAAADRPERALIAPRDMCRRCASIPSPQQSSPHAKPPPPERHPVREGEEGTAWPREHHMNIGGVQSRKSARWNTLATRGNRRSPHPLARTKNMPVEEWTVSGLRDGHDVAVGMLPPWQWRLFKLGCRSAIHSVRQRWATHQSAS